MTDSIFQDGNDMGFLDSSDMGFYSLMIEVAGGVRDFKFDNEVKMKKIIILTLLFVLSAIPAMAAETTTTLSWTAPSTNEDDSPLTDLGGYIVYYGISSGNYTQSIDVGNVTTYEVSGLAIGTTYYFAVKAYDTSYNKSIYSNELKKFLADTISPLITNIIASKVADHSITIGWSTDEISDSQIVYGPTSDYGESTSIDTDMTINHTQSIEGLKAATTYHYRVLSRDAAGNLATSDDFIFITKKDVTAPRAPVCKLVDRIGR